MAGDREDRRERGLEALVLAIHAGRVGLQEGAVRRELRLQQEGHLEDARALGEALPNALLFGKGIGRGLGGRHIDVSRLRFVRHACRRSACASVRRARTDAVFPASTVAGHCAPGVVAGRYQPLADDAPGQGASDQTRFLQSSQGAKRSIRIWGPNAWLQSLRTEATRTSSRPGLTASSESKNLLSAGSSYLEIAGRARRFPAAPRTLT